MFANTVCTLEEKDTSRYGEDTKSTNKVFDKLIEKNDHRVNQPMVLRARLLDILIADFDLVRLTLHRNVPVSCDQARCAR
jgi:hypothetical protein